VGEVKPGGALVVKVREGLMSGFYLLGVTAGVEDGKNHDAFLVDAKVNHERKAPNNCATNLASDFRKHLWIVRNALKVFFYGSSKFLPQAFALTLIPANGLIKL
jgi:hypothetical protein